MTDLVQFMNRTDLPVFEQAAVAHAQFETIHPFPDGNGRVGRALIHALYKHAGLTRNVTIPVSAGLLRDPELYFASLDEYRKGNVAAIVELMTSATYFAIENGKLLSRELADVKAQWRDGFKTRAGSTVEQLVDFLIRQPAIDTPLVQQEFSLSQQSAQVAINRLVEGGILKPASESKRNRRWVATEIIEALDRFAERSRRKKLR
jgi:Fic family protein